MTGVQTCALPISTVLAAVLEGYSATGIEVSDEYVRLARERIEQELVRSLEASGGQT